MFREWDSNTTNLCRPQMDYSPEVWDPISQRRWRLLEEEMSCPRSQSMGKWLIVG